MRDALKRICDLQPFYSAENTPQMQERGRILRDSLKPAIEAMQRPLSAALGPFGGDFLVEASDGIGRKTELPWVRFCSQSMSPSPTEGFYSVIHFSTDGTAIHITACCGSSRFHHGSSVPLPDAELDAQTSWARGVIIQSFGNLEPFIDAPDFGARRKLPISFQRATVISKKVDYSDIVKADIEGLLEQAAGRLRAIYNAQAMGRDLTEADQSELEIAAVLNPKRSKSFRQGYGLPAAARREVELRAMYLAEEWLREHGYEVKDTSATASFDFEARRGEEILKVEVKGTTSDQVDAILMTKNEVDLHRNEKGSTALIIVSQIRLVQVDGIYAVEGGKPEIMIGWDIDNWQLEPTAFRLSRR